ncbi:calnexin-like [Mugil cephalus]|uniref:calnexin-like n=1 Tax=Mugil cephalus TaxID=48193 RepID=UPI001FB5BCDC|nr:calnexin-like [Mugil cephalus]
MMKISFVLLFMTLAGSVAPVSAAAEMGLVESLLVATFERPWLWGLYIFTVGLPIVLFISFMWPDKRFGPPDQPYWYKKSDDDQPDDPDISPATQSANIKRAETRARTSGQETTQVHKRTLKKHNRE